MNSSTDAILLLARRRVNLGDDGTIDLDALDETLSDVEANLRLTKDNTEAIVQQHSARPGEAFVAPSGMESRLTSVQQEIRALASVWKDAALRGDEQRQTERANSWEERLQFAKGCADAVRSLGEVHQRLLAIQPAIDAGQWSNACRHLNAARSALRHLKENSSSMRGSGSVRALEALDEACSRSRAAVVHHLWQGWRSSVDFQRGDDAASAAASVFRFVSLGEDRSAVDATTVGWCRVLRSRPGHDERDSLRTPGQLLAALCSIDRRSSVSAVEEWSRRVLSVLCAPLLQGGRLLVQESRRDVAIAVLQDGSRSMHDRVSDVHTAVRTLLGTLFPEAQAEDSGRVGRLASAALWRGAIRPRKEDEGGEEEGEGNDADFLWMVDELPGHEPAPTDDGDLAAGLLSDSGEEEDDANDDDYGDDDDGGEGSEAWVGDSTHRGPGRDLVARMKRGLLSGLDAAIDEAMPWSSVSVGDAQPVADAAADCEQWMVSQGYLEQAKSRYFEEVQKNLLGRFVVRWRRKLLESARSACLQSMHNSIDVTDGGESGDAGRESFPNPSILGGCAGRDGFWEDDGWKQAWETDSASFPASVERVPDVGTFSGGPVGNGPSIDTPPFLQFPACHVSRCADQLVQLAKDALLAAKDESSQVARVLYFTVRDCLDMYRAVVPVVHASSIASVPRLAMLVHNDGLFIAHNAATLALPVRSALPEPLPQAASFADLIAPFRHLAERLLVHQLRLQRRTVIQLTTGADPSAAEGSTVLSVAAFRDDDAAMEAERSVKRAIHHLSQLRVAWEDVLARHVFVACMGHLVDVLLAVVADATAKAEPAGDEREDGEGASGGRSRRREQQSRWARTGSQLLRNAWQCLGWLRADGGDRSDSELERFVPHLPRAKSLRATIEQRSEV